VRGAAAFAASRPSRARSIGRRKQADISVSKVSRDHAAEDGRTERLPARRARAAREHERQHAEDKAKAVISIGRRRSRPASSPPLTTASLPRGVVWRFDDQNRFFAARPISP